MKKQNQNKYGRIALALLLVVGIVTTVAFLTKPTETVENVFTVGKIEEPEIVEPSWPDVDPKDPEKPYEPEIIPGKVIPKDPTLTFGDKTIDSYAFMAVRSYMIYKDDKGLVKDAMTYHDVSDNWEYVRSETKDDSVIHLYRYREIVDENTGIAVEGESNRKQLEPLFQEVSFSKDLSSEQIDQIITSAGENSHTGTQKVSVKGFIHQAYDGDDLLNKEEVTETVGGFLFNTENW